MDKQRLATILQEGGRLVSMVMRACPRRKALAELVYPSTDIHIQTSVATTEAVRSKPSMSVSTEETIQYQKREIGKELLLLEKHLQQKCKIASKPCDCCRKHPVTLEALAQETMGMAPDPALAELIVWVRTIEPMTTEEASASGKYDDEYPEMAVKARELRKAIMPVEAVESESTPAPMTQTAKEPWQMTREEAKVKAAVIRPVEEEEFIPDSPEYLAQSIKDCGWREKLDEAFLQRMKKVRGA